VFFSYKRRKDEIGVLVNKIYYILCMMHNRVLVKRSIPKHPMNPFYDGTGGSDVEWSVFYKAAIVGKSAVTAVPIDIASKGAGSLDVLSSVKREIDQAKVIASAPVLATAPSEPAAYTTIEMVKGIASELDEKLYTSPVLVQLPPATERVSTLRSLKCYFYTMSFFIVAGVIALVVSTMFVLNESGYHWMDNTGKEMFSKQMESLESVSASKGRFVDVRFNYFVLHI
jgi:hypothetical protein